MIYWSANWIILQPFEELAFTARRVESLVAISSGKKSPDIHELPLKETYLKSYFVSLRYIMVYNSHKIDSDHLMYGIGNLLEEMSGGRKYE